MAAQPNLAGTRVLVAEDQAGLARMLAVMLRQFGCEVLGPLATVREAEQSLRSNAPDVCLLDVRLRDGDSFPLARQLLEQGIPFVFSTGFDNDRIEADLQEVTLLVKPYTQEAVGEALLEALQAHGARRG